MNNERRSIVTVLFTLFVAVLGVSAEEELEVSGIMVYSIYKAPINESLDISFINNPRGVLRDLSSYETEKYSNTLEELQNRAIKSGFGNCKTCKSLSTELSGYSFSCDCQGTELIYDGYWLIGRRRVLSSDFELNLTEAGRVTWPVENQIDDSIKNVTNDEHFLVHHVLTLLHFNRITPPRLSDKQYYPSPEMFSVEINDSFKRQICAYLAEPDTFGRESCVSRFASLERPVGQDRYLYFIRVSASNRTDDLNYWVSNMRYGKVIYIAPSEDILYSLKYNDILSSLSYIIYGRDTAKAYAEDILNQIRSLDNNLSDLKKQIRNKTLNDFSAVDRLNNLGPFKEELDNKELLAGNLSQALTRIKGFYDYQDYRTNAIQYKDYPDELFRTDIDRLHNKLSNDISELDGLLNLVDKKLVDLRQIYYNELDSARAEKSSMDSNKTNSNVLFLAILAIFVSILANLENLIPDKARVDKWLNILMKFWYVVLVSLILLYYTNFVLFIFLLIVLGIVLFILIPFNQVSNKPAEDQLNTVHNIKSILFIITIGILFTILNKAVEIKDIPLEAFGLTVITLTVILLPNFVKKKDLDVTPLIEQQKQTNNLLSNLVNAPMSEPIQERQGTNKNFSVKKLLGGAILLFGIRQLFKRKKKQHD